VKAVSVLDEEPILIDFKIEGLKKIRGIPIEQLGVYSFISQTKPRIIEEEKSQRKKKRSYLED
jgi:hypothetical protein